MLQMWKGWTVQGKTCARVKQDRNVGSGERRSILEENALYFARVVRSHKPWLGTQERVIICSTIKLCCPVGAGESSQRDYPQGWWHCVWQYNAIVFVKNRLSTRIPKSIVLNETIHVFYSYLYGVPHRADAADE